MSAFLATSVIGALIIIIFWFESNHDILYMKNDKYKSMLHSDDSSVCHDQQMFP